MVEALRLRNSLELAIAHLRRGDSCRVKVKNLEPVNSNYRVKGTYMLIEYMLFSGGKILERGEFEALLDKEYNVVSIKITPSIKAS